MSKFKELCDKLEAKIVNSYEQGVSLEDAERLAGEFLHGQLIVSNELKRADLDSRMRKSGVKAVKAALYLELCSKAEKKPTESALDHMLAVNEIVSREQDELDRAESERDDLERYYNVFREAHIFFRGVSRGRME